MKRTHALAGVIGVMLAATPATSERRPIPGPGDPHVQQVTYDPDELVTLELPTGYQTVLQFDPSERIESVAVGDSGAWQASANRRGDYLFVKAMQQGVRSNMVVITDAHVYSFELVPAFGVTPTTPFTVRFVYPPAVPLVAGPGAEPAARPVDTNAPPARPVEWRLTGAKRLYPATITSQGDETIVTWAAKAPLPAVYGIDGQGQERLVNAMIENRRLVVETGWRALVFRLEGEQAMARIVEVRP